MELFVFNRNELKILFKITHIKDLINSMNKGGGGEGKMGKLKTES